MGSDISAGPTTCKLTSKDQIPNVSGDIGQEDLTVSFLSSSISLLPLGPRASPASPASRNPPCVAACRYVLTGSAL